ncbi:hypothetical protein Ahy_B02g060430 [Arachis hypogaea]|uniref:Uncharacterized protein n=1 Tax=Arachis hypogaea TaxID=3818 RepID=A0A445AIG6_ARAHY|nr:hypothetical protein Ahy_B02g060430 [Arachis hypogaea]
MHRKARYTKRTIVETPCQQPPTGAPASSPPADDDWFIPLPSNGGVFAAASLRPFRPPRSEPRPETQTCANGVQMPEPCDEDLHPEANEVGLFDQHIDNMFAASDPKKHKGRKTTEFWNIDLIDFDGVIKQEKMSVREAMERPLNGSKIILRFNVELQPIGDGAGLLSGILRALGFDYSKFPVCEKSWAKVTGKDREMFHFHEHSGGRIKKTFLQQMGRSWKDTKGRLCYVQFSCLTNLIVDDIIGKVQAKCVNRKKQLYTHTGGSKSLARRREEEII